jgi:hypothetical protein
MVREETDETIRLKVCLRKLMEGVELPAFAGGQITYQARLAIASERATVLWNRNGNVFDAVFPRLRRISARVLKIHRHRSVFLEQNPQFSHNRLI